MEEITLIPEIRFTQFSGPWKSTKLNQILRISNEKNQLGQYNKSQVLSVTAEKGVVNQIEYHGRSYAGKSVKPYGVLKKGQLVYTKSPLKKYPYGIIKFNNFQDGIVSTLYAIYSLRKNIDGKFIDYLFYYPERINRYLKPLVNIGAKNDMKVNNEFVLSEFVVIPILSEQQKIADFLSTVDQKIQVLTRKKELLEEYKKGVMQRIFNYDLENDELRLRFKPDEGGEFPEWEEKKLKDISQRVKRKNKENNQNILTISSIDGLVSQSDYFNRIVASKDVTNYYLLHRNEFAYNKSYSAGYPMGSIKRLNLYDKGVLSTLYICFKIKGNQNLKFFEYYFESQTQNREIQKIAQEGARNHGLLNMGIDDFFSIKLRVPSLEEQNKIVLFLDQVENKLVSTRLQLDYLNEWKKGLLQKMFV